MTYKKQILAVSISIFLSVTIIAVAVKASTSVGNDISVGSTLTVTGATVLNGGLAMDTNKFTVADGTGNTTIVGTLDVTGTTTLASVLYANQATGYVGIGTTTPEQKLAIAYGNLSFTTLDAPGAPTATVNAAAGNLNGNYYYRITFVTSEGGETLLGDASSVVSPSNQQVNLSNIPTAPSYTGVTSRKIYRTKAGSSSYYYLVTTLNDNTTTTYTDNIADDSLSGLARRTIYLNDTTAGVFYIDGSIAGSLGSNTTGWGYKSLFSNDTGWNDTAIGVKVLYYNSSGTHDNGVGYAALFSNTSGGHNNGLGCFSNFYNTTGDGNSAIGAYALQHNTSGSYNTGLGCRTNVYYPSSSMTGSAQSGSGLSVGIYYYRVSFVLDGQETNLSPPASTAYTTTEGNQQMALSSIPTYSGPMTCTDRKIYRSQVDQEDYRSATYYLVTTVDDNTTTIYTDTTADDSLGAAFDGPDYMLALGAYAEPMFSNQLVVGGSASGKRITESYWGSGVYVASPSDFSFNASGGSGTNNAGASLILAGGKSTGSAVGGSLIFKTSPVGSSGSSFNSLVERMRITSDGNVGIGTTTPSGDLHVLDTTASSTVYIGNAAHSGCIVMGDSDNGGLTYITVLDGVLTATSTKPDICK